MNFYKKFLSVFLTSLCCMLAGAVNAQQNYPVLSTLQLTPPYSLYLNEYSAPGAQKMQVNLFLKDLTKNNYPCRLRIKIEGFGIGVYSKPDFYAAPLYLNASEMRTIAGDELAPYLNPSNLIFQGISLTTFQNNGGKLPEGVYRITVEALDYFNKKVVSNAASTVLAAYLSYPPIINLPLPNSKVSTVDPQNVLFQWTPRHTGSVNAAYNVAYKFSLVPIIPPVTDPNVAVQSTPPIFETFTDQTFLAYGAAEPALEKGSSYAVKVQAVEADGKDIFLNDGNSEVLKFTYGNACETPFNILAELASASSLKVSWTAWPGQDAFMIRIRKANEPNAAWFEYSVTQPEYILSGLMPGNTYEYQVKGNCASGNGNYSELQWFQVPTPELGGTLVCKSPDEPNTRDMNPANALTYLREGMFFFAGAFPITVTQVSGDRNGFNGKGTVGIPFLNSFKFFVTLNNITLDKDLKLTGGSVIIDAESLDSSIEALIAAITVTPDADGNAEAIENGSLPNVIDVIIPEPGVLPVYNPGTNSITIQTVKADGVTQQTVTIKLKGTQPPYVFQDKNGETYEVTKNEAGTVTVTRREKKPITDMLPGGSRTSHPISVANARVTFSALPNDAQNYGFDKFNISLKDKSKYTESYTSANESPVTDNRISWKSVESGRGDRVTAVLESNDPSITAAGLVFKNGKGDLIGTAAPSGNTFTIDMIGAPEGNDKEIYAYHAVGANKDTGLYLGKLNVASFKGIKKRVVIVPVNGAGASLDAAQIQARLNSIYKQATVSWEVEIKENFSYDLGTNGLEADNSDLLNAYTSEQKGLASAYKKAKSLEGGKYYIFIVNAFSVTEQEGYMVRNGQVGFVKAGSNVLRTIAHELGHGAFSLKHTWEEFGTTQGATTNLMDYGSGAELWYRQWKYMRNADIIFRPFEGDDDGSMVTMNTLLPASLANPDGNFSLVTPAGHYIIIPKDSKNVTFMHGLPDLSYSFIVTGTLFSFKVGEKEYKASFDASKQNFLGYKNGAETYAATLSQTYVPEKVIMGVPSGTSFNLAQYTAPGLKGYTAASSVIVSETYFTVDPTKRFQLEPYNNKNIVAETQQAVTQFELDLIGDQDAKREYFILLKIAQLRNYYPELYTQFETQFNATVSAAPELSNLLASNPFEFYLKKRVEILKFYREKAGERKLFLASLSTKTCDQISDWIRQGSETDLYGLSVDNRIDMLAKLTNCWLTTPKEFRVLDLINFVKTEEIPAFQKRLLEKSPLSNNNKTLITLLCNQMHDVGIVGKSYSELVKSITSLVAKSPDYLSSLVRAFSDQNYSKRIIRWGNTTNSKAIVRIDGADIDDSGFITIRRSQYDGEYTSFNGYGSTTTQLWSSLPSISLSAFELVHFSNHSSIEEVNSITGVPAGEMVQLPAIAVLYSDQKRFNENVGEAIQIGVDVVALASTGGAALGLEAVTKARRAWAIYEAFNATADIAITLGNLQNDPNYGSVIKGYQFVNMVTSVGEISYTVSKTDFTSYISAAKTLSNTVSESAKNTVINFVKTMDALEEEVRAGRKIISDLKAFERIKAAKVKAKEWLAIKFGWVDEINIPRMVFNNVDEFAATFDAERKLSSTLRGEAWNYFKQGKWKELEDLFNLNSINGGWPPNRGFIRYTEEPLTIGATFDRYGGYIDNTDGLFKDNGTFASPLGASFESRALPLSTKTKPYRKYRVIKTIPGVKAGEAIPWFEQRGNGIQYEFPENYGIDFLLKNSYIEAIN